MSLLLSAAHENCAFVCNQRQLKDVEGYDVDFEHQFIEAEKFDAKPTYKKFLGYRPDVAVIVVSEVTVVVFLVPLPNPFAFIIEHFIDLTNILLHLTCHPLVFLVEHILNRLPVCIRNFDRNLQLGWGFFQHIIDVLVDGFYLTADRTNGIAFRNLDFIEEDVLDRVRNPDLPGFTTCIDREKSLLRFWLWLNFGLIPGPHHIWRLR